jgi:hypothetical protein
LRLAVKIAEHPVWECNDNEPAARMELKQTAWSAAVR